MACAFRDVLDGARAEFELLGADLRTDFLVGLRAGGLRAAVLRAGVFRAVGFLRADDFFFAAAGFLELVVFAADFLDADPRAVGFFADPRALDLLDERFPLPRFVAAFLAVDLRAVVFFAGLMGPGT